MASLQVIQWLAPGIQAMSWRVAAVVVSIVAIILMSIFISNFSSTTPTPVGTQAALGIFGILFTGLSVWLWYHSSREISKASEKILNSEMPGKIPGLENSMGMTSLLGFKTKAMEEADRKASEDAKNKPADEKSSAETPKPAKKGLWPW